MRKAWLNPLAVLASLLLIAAGSTLIVFARSHATVPDRSLPGRAPSRRTPNVRFASASFASWSLLDRDTGAIAGSANLAEQGDTMSMIKVWIAADYLRRQASIPDRSILERLSIMIRDSDNEAAVEFHLLNGEQESIARMNELCGLTESHSGRTTNRWSDTVMSARDAARLGACVAGGRAAGPWTQWLLAQMRLVRGDGDFGPRKAFPAEVAAKIAIKNGWFIRPDDDQWHFACLAVSDHWSLAVLARYPAALGETHGQMLCQSAGEQLRESAESPLSRTG